MNRFRAISLTWKVWTATSTIALLGIVLALCGMAQAAPDYQVIRALAIQGIYSPVIQDAVGNLYGTTYNGGNYGSGTVFKLAPDGSGFTVLHSFDGANDGAGPTAGLTLASDGKLYGVSNGGGNYGSGTVFKLAPDGSGFTVLHSFDGANDGARPYAGLTLGSDGNFYGTTSEGGAHDLGTVYSLAPNGSGFTVLHSFDGANDGAIPRAGLTQSSGGNFYGTTSEGGANDFGTVYTLAPDGSGFTVLHSFGGANDGAIPYAGLTLGSDGSFYGTTVGGGSAGNGAVYKFAPDGSGFTVVHSFDGANGGAIPYAGLTLGSDGNFYGTTVGGGANNFGTVYKLAPDGLGFTVLHSFDGTHSYAGLTQGSDGNFYGTTIYGGISFSTVYRLSPSGSGFTVLHSFDGIDKANLLAGLTLGSDGNFYGASANGGSSGGYGTVYKIDPSGSTFTLLHSFGFADGSTPYAGLILGSDGKFYGTAVSGGGTSSGYGTVYEIDPSGTPFTLLHPFLDLVNGAAPVAGLTQGSDGNLYGTTVNGGADGFGIVYRIAPGGSGFIVLRSFDGTNDGAYPYAALTQGSDGNFYGTSAGGGSGSGTVYKLAGDGSGFTVLHSFDGADGGANPAAGLILDSDGNFFGTTVGGGSAGNGTVYKLATDGTFTVLHSFDGANDGANPYAGLILGSDGNFFGTTHGGGSGAHGTVFEIAPDGTFAVLHSFDYTNGGDPYAGLTQGSDGNFYGTTMNGAQGGVIYRICLATCTTTTLATSLNPSTFGSSVTFTATVTGSNPTGTVTFNDGAATLGAAAVSDGQATFTTSSLSIGTHSIIASYSGDTNYSPSSSTALSQVVNRALTATTTTLKSRPNPSKFGASVTFTATVMGSKPTGTVTFRDGATVIGTGTIKKGKAAFATRSLSASAHSITASYDGDANNAGSTSEILIQIVRPRK